MSRQRCRSTSTHTVPAPALGLHGSWLARVCFSPDATVKDRAIRTVPAARSTSDHRSATSSPRRAPVSAARATAVARTGSSPSTTFRSAVSRSGVGTTISLRSTLGGVARSVGAEVSQPHLTRLAAGRADDRVVLVHRRRRQPFVEPLTVGPVKQRRRQLAEFHGSRAWVESGD